MKASGKSIIANLRHMVGGLRGSGSAKMYAGDEPPLRSELFSSEQMKQHGKTLAGSHKLGPRGIRDQLLARLAENERILTGACKHLTSAVNANRRIAPAGEWLLDNFYLIEEQIRTAKRHLPKGYSRELPRLLDGPSAGLPRVYDIAHEAISHGDGRVDPESLSSFVASYQKVTVLKLGELWAIPIMLRLALIENLRRVGARVVVGSIHRDLAARWAEQMMEIAEKDPKSLILLTADMARSDPPMVSSFVAEFARRLQGQSTALALPLTWIEQRLSESGLTIEQLVRSENQQMAADQVSISNSIGSLRFLGAMDWRAFVETMSAVDQVLREDPGGAYEPDGFHHPRPLPPRCREDREEEPFARSRCGAQGDPAGRRGHGQERTGRSSGACRVLPDRQGIAAAATGSGGAPADPRGSPARGRPVPFAPLPGLDPSVDVVISPGAWWRRRMPAGCRIGRSPCSGALSLLCASRLAVALVNWLATLLVTPRPLPRMDFSEGIPPKSRTLVVIPTMLTGPRNIEDLVESLEVRFLANRDDNLHFGLLTDFRDASEATIPEDEPLLRLAREGIEGLNEKYRGERNDAFFLFHRPRRWNPQERIWMGYERKRGKLAELNLLLRGEAGDRFSLVIGETAVLQNVKYVITLDTDTLLPRDSARQFVGAMAHPLNRARYDEHEQRVTEGYGILQPRVAVSLPETNRSRYAQLCGSEPGIDPYTRAVSDVYQDVFDEGSFIGKGIYDVDAFEQALKGRLPENRILSHDLLEGCHARSGLLSDVHLYEEYPSSYVADVNRRHRWIRGDWQIAGWLLSRVPGPGDVRRRNPLSGLSQWKIFDNLRRSLEPSALTLLLLLGWNTLSPAWYWTLSVIGILLIPSLMASALEMFRKPADALLRQHLAAEARSAGRRFAPGRLYDRVPAVRGGFQPGRGRAHGRADAVHAQAASRMATVGEPGPQSRRRPGGLLPIDVDRPRDRRCRDDPPRVFEAGRAGDGRAHPGPVVCLPRHRLVDQPPARSPKSGTFGGPDPLSPEAFTEDLGVLRNLRRSGRPLAATGQLPGIPRRRGCPSHVADQHGACAPRESGRLRLRIPSVGTTRRAHGKCAAHDGYPGATSRSFLQLVRHAIPETAAASLRLDGGQRKPRGAPADVAAGPARTSGSRHPGGAMAGGHKRHLSGSGGRRGGNPALPACAIPGDSGGLDRFPSDHARGGEALPRAADGKRRGNHRQFQGCQRWRTEPMGASPRASMPGRPR